MTDCLEIEYIVIIVKVLEIATFISNNYSHLSNSRGGCNKRGGCAKVPESKNVLPGN